ncbi:MAG: nodulation protein NfeD [Bacillota bacterium]
MDEKSRLTGVIIICLSFALLALICLPHAVQAAERPVYLVDLDGTITAGQNNYLQRQVEKAIASDAQLMVLVINTPGGLVDATLEINRLFMNAPIPIAVIVAPSGAIAGSAGAFIIISADIAAMAPGTTVGAAQPVSISPEGTESADDKTVTFYANHLRSIAEEKGRPPDVAEKFVTENLTLSAGEALDIGLIDYIVIDVPELLAAVDGLVVEKQNESYILQTKDVPLYSDEMNLREMLQNWIGDPQISFLVLILGLLGIYFGLGAPGTIVPEVTGAILLILGIYGIGLFDTSTTGIILLLLGVGLIIAEIFTAGFGIMGIGGAASIIAGAILMPVEPLMAREWYATFMITVVGTVIGLLIILIFVIQRIIHSRKQWNESSSYLKPPQKGIVITDLNPEGMIKSQGELWKARSENKSLIKAGTEVEVARAETLMLYVRPVVDQENQPGGSEGMSNDKY